MKIAEYNEMMAYLLRPATGGRENFSIGGRVKLADGLSPEIKKRIKNFENITGENYDAQPAWKRYDIREDNWKGTGSEVKLTDEMKSNIKEFEERTGQKYEDLDYQKKKALRDGRPVGVLPTKKEMKSRISVDDKGVPKFPNKEMEKQFIKDVKKKLKFPKATKNIPEELKAKGLSEKYPISERQVERAIRYYREKLNLEYKKGAGTSETSQKRTEYIRKNSNQKFESLLTGNPEFHKSHMSDLYTQNVKTGTLGYARANINLEDLKETDIKMNALYKKRNRLLKQKPKNLNILLDEINQKGTDLAAKSGGYKKFEAIDPITKKPFVINFSSVAQELDPTDILENKNLSELMDIDKPTVLTLKEESLKNIQKIKGVTTADKIPTPEKTKTREMFEQANKRLSDGPTLGMNLGLGKALGSALKYVPTPAATVGLSAGFGIDPESSLDRTILGTELAAAPALVKQSSRIASNPLLRRALNLGLSPQMAMRAARVASPIGIASLIGEGVYTLGKEALSEQDRIDAMSPDERDEYLDELESYGDFSA